MKTLILASVSAIALTFAGTGVGHAGTDANSGTSSSMQNGSNTTGMSHQGEQATGHQGEQANAEVKDIQQKLKTAGLYQGAVDGIDGPQTKQALEQFQQQNGLPQTGRLDHETLAKLNANESGVGSGSSTEPQAKPNGGGASGTNDNSNPAGGGMRH